MSDGGVIIGIAIAIFMAGGVVGKAIERNELAREMCPGEWVKKDSRIVCLKEAPPE